MKKERMLYVCMNVRDNTSKAIPLALIRFDGDWWHGLGQNVLFALDFTFFFSFLFPLFLPLNLEHFYDGMHHKRVIKSLSKHILSSCRMFQMIHYFYFERIAIQSIYHQHLRLSIFKFDLMSKLVAVFFFFVIQIKSLYFYFSRTEILSIFDNS